MCTHVRTQFQMWLTGLSAHTDENVLILLNAHFARKSSVKFVQYNMSFVMSSWSALENRG